MRKDDSKITFDYEKAVIESGFDKICGIDEVGRGAWAGPLVGAGVILPPDFDLNGLNDSKKLSDKQRRETAIRIKEMAEVWEIVEIESKEIDIIGIGEANRQLVWRILDKMNANFALIDHIWMDSDMQIPCQVIVKGDERVASIAAASILAKVHRDDIMYKLDQKFPGYNFSLNKGYGTRDHEDALRKKDYTPVHRKSYQPILQPKLF